MLKTVLCGIALGLMMAVPVQANDASDLGFAEFTTDVQASLNYPAHYSLELGALATIEFYVRADWEDVPDYDPVILSALGKNGARYGVVMTRNKDSIGLFSSADWDNVEFDFDDGKRHHVAFVIQGDLTDVYIDGSLVGSLAQGVAENVEPMTFHIGSLNGAMKYFTGELGIIHLWDTAVDPDDINTFKNKSVLTTARPVHPDQDMLVAYSEFSNEGRNFSLTDNNMTAEELIEDLNIAFAEMSPDNAGSDERTVEEIEVEISRLLPEEELSSDADTPNGSE